MVFKCTKILVCSLLLLAYGCQGEDDSVNSPEDSNSEKKNGNNPNGIPNQSSVFCAELQKAYPQSGLSCEGSLFQFQQKDTFDTWFLMGISKTCGSEKSRQNARNLLEKYKKHEKQGDYCLQDGGKKEEFYKNHLEIYKVCSFGAGKGAVDLDFYNSPWNPEFVNFLENVMTTWEVPQENLYLCH